MDDLKLFAKDDDNLKGLIQTVRNFTDDTGMKFALNKCAKVTFESGKLIKSPSIKLDKNTTIKELQQEEVYTYLGVNRSSRIQHATMNEKISEECYQRVRAILKIELNLANRTEAVNTLAIPAISYKF